MSGFVPRNPITGEPEVIHGMSLPQSLSQSNTIPTFRTKIRSAIMTSEYSPLLQDCLARPEIQDAGIRMETKIRQIIDSDTTLDAGTKALFASKSVFIRELPIVPSSNSIQMA
jgi:hypothetical protein